ncbi:hypothetical protein [Paenibacillus sp. CF384]|uniref:hypothetical protein n=1 Tax=Paenibacillus sp. CF384 TaxID=1884382 RepID=UPI0008994052|nr:hypothetical protein [Paenibacillus sp. CF384]SDX63555.1 hypothetical protein SAMN05518855_1017149 [Paenibacillus sp. CF384]
MRNRTRKTLSVLISAMMIVTLIVGCSNNKNNNENTGSTATNETATNTNTATNTETSTETNTTEPAAEPAAYYDMLDKVSDSSELPDWTGKQLNLKAWYTHGSGDAKRPSSDKDVVTPEIKRVTGVTIDKDGSFDNGGQDVKVKMGLLNASNDWPDIAFVDGDMAPFQDLIKAGKVYELTDAIAQYAPHVAKRMPFDVFPLIKEQITSKHLDGDKIWGFPTMVGNPDGSIKQLNPDFVPPSPLNSSLGYNWIWVRDDILKMMYPNAKTQDEIDALYLKNGKFTKEEIFDVPIKSTDDMIKFLYDVQKVIKDKGLKENGKPVQVTYGFGGGDNWSLMTQLFNNVYRIPANNNYFTYYDKASKSIKYSFQQDWFKSGIAEFNKLVRDKVMDPNSLLENNATHLEKLNNGQYAVPYMYDTPDAAVLKAANKPYRYRKLFIDAPIDFSRTIMPYGQNGINYSIMIFKDKVSEEDLPQVLRFLDYMISETGEKMYEWGPKSAGLFEEKDGKRVFVNKDLEDAMVYTNQANGAQLSYNLFNTRIGTTDGYGFAWPYYPSYMWGAGPLAPYNTYTRTLSAADALGFFDPGNLPGEAQSNFATMLNKGHEIWNFFGSVAEADAFWKNRDAFEKTLTKTLAAKDDAQFESMWKEFQALAVQQGADEKSLEAMTKYFNEQNKDYLGNIK